MKKINKNAETAGLIRELKQLSIQQKVNFWKRIAVELEKPSRNRRVVNISKISRHAKPSEIVIVPGKVLSAGELDKDVVVCAHRFSSEAEKKIKQKGKALTIPELMKANPKAKNVRILG